MDAFRIFVSSPGDAQFERMRVERVAERLSGELADTARFEVIRWERDFYAAHATFQEQIPESKDCDIVVAILRHRLGTELPADFPRMINGEPYPSGTAYEILTALEACRSTGLPDVYVFRYTEPPTVKLDDADTSARIAQQWERLKVFFTQWFLTPEGHFTAAFHTFGTTDQFEEQFERLLRAWVDRRIVKNRTVTWPIESKGSPFCGLAAFRAKHAPVFVGRGREIATAVDMLKDSAEHGLPFLLLVGGSGCGKSSLALAGLVPRLTAAGVVPAVDVWRRAVIRPSDSPVSPIDALAARLFGRPDAAAEDAAGDGVALPELALGDYPTPETLVPLLAHADDTSVRPILRALDHVAEAERRTGGYERPVRVALALAVDQLDELFGADVDPPTRQTFARLLLLLLRTGRVWIVATLRANLYEDFLKDPALLDLKSLGRTYDVAPPSATSLVEIVREPARAAGLAYEIDAVSGERLDERLLRDVERPDMLPLLQFTLDRLFRQRTAVDGETRLTFAAYAALGGIDGAIDGAGEEAIGGLGRPEMEALPRLMRQLVVVRTEDGGPVDHRGLSTHSVSPEVLDRDPPMRRLAHALVAARLLVLGESGAVRLVHQRVVESWRRVGDVVRSNSDFHRILGDVRAQLQRWIASGGDPSTLVPKGRPLTDANDLTNHFGSEIDSGITVFAQASRWRQLMWSSNRLFIVIFALMLVTYSIINAQFEKSAAILSGVFGITLVGVWPLTIGAINLNYARKFMRLRNIISIDEKLKVNKYHQSASKIRMMGSISNALHMMVFSICLVIILIVGTFDIIPDAEPGSLDQFLRIGFLMLLLLSWMLTLVALRIWLRRAISVMPSKTTWLRSVSSSGRYVPIIVLSALGVSSGFAASFCFPMTKWYDYAEAMQNPWFYGLGLIFASIVSYGELYWGKSRPYASIFVFFGAVVAWVASYSAANWSFKLIEQISNGSADEIPNTLPLSASVAGFIGGALGAHLLALAIPTLRRRKRWAVATAIGAVSGLLLYLDASVQNDTSLSILFIGWQTLFLMYLGYCLDRDLRSGNYGGAPLPRAGRGYAEIAEPAPLPKRPAAASSAALAPAAGGERA